ncbi:MAG: serine acetyltransferase [Deltaproteobacteria bacterium]|nr:serine acetyltransferase [Deltaproteobacteria bacterium]
MPAQPKQYKELESAIDAVVESYDQGRPIDNLESAALPNKRAAIEALRELQPVLFAGFYATRALSRDNLRHTIAEHLYRAHDLLVEQIERALNYEAWLGRRGSSNPPPPSASSSPVPLAPQRPAAPCPGSGEDVVLALFSSLPEIRRLLDGDLQAAFEGDPSSESIDEVVFSYPSIAALTAHRVAHRLWQEGVPLLPRILTEHAHSRTGIDIHPGATIGERFFIDHGTGVVVGETAVIGDDVKLYQNVTLGALSVPRDRSDRRKRHPTLGDRVTVYSGATILGGDTVIGHDSVVGGNVWITKSVKPGSKIFGRPKND